MLSFEPIQLRLRFRNTFFEIEVQVWFLFCCYSCFGMRHIAFWWILTILFLFGDNTHAQRRHLGRTIIRNYTGKKPVVIQHRTPDAVNYYDHEHGAKIIKSSHFEFDYMLGRKITFFCMAQGEPRPVITWFKDGVELYQHRFFQVHESAIGNDIIKSKMEIDPTTQMDAGYYECQADNQYAIDRRGFRTDYVMINY